MSTSNIGGMVIWVVLLVAISGCFSGDADSEDPPVEASQASTSCTDSLYGKWSTFCDGGDWTLEYEDCMRPLAGAYYSEATSPLPTGWTPNELVPGVRQGIVDAIACADWITDEGSLGSASVAYYGEAINSASPSLVELYVFYLVTDNAHLAEAFTLMGFDAEVGVVDVVQPTADTVAFEYSSSFDDVSASPAYFSPAFTGLHTTRLTTGTPASPISYDLNVTGIQGQAVPVTLTVMGTVLEDALGASAAPALSNPTMAADGTLKVTV